MFLFFILIVWIWWIDYQRYISRDYWQRNTLLRGHGTMQRRYCRVPQPNVDHFKRVFGSRRRSWFSGRRCYVRPFVRIWRLWLSILCLYSPTISVAPLKTATVPLKKTKQSTFHRISHHNRPIRPSIPIHPWVDASFSKVLVLVGRNSKSCKTWTIRRYRDIVGIGSAVR